MSATICQILFWTSLAGLFYTFAGYPLLMFILAPRKSAAGEPVGAEAPFTVTVVIAAHNEESRILPRVENLLASDYPADRLEIIVVSDGSTDQTSLKIRSLDNPRVRVIDQPQRSGKAHALNLAVAAAGGQRVVFADARQRFDRAAIAALAAHFRRPETGAVSGELLIDPAGSAAGGGIDAYWRLEKLLRFSEARRDSTIGCTGAIYAIRRELYRPIPDDTILDDVVIPMQIAVQGRRVAFEPGARAYDPQALEPAREAVRKRRTLAGNYQMLFRYPAWLLPWRDRLWWQLLSHKYLRLAAPFLLLLQLASNTFLLRTSALYAGWWGLQVIFYGLAACGLALRQSKARIVSLPAGFVFLNWMALAGLWHYLTRKNRFAWELNRAEGAPASHV
jgi:cellulose synthase/poly-beta-1,6-N-acetylglucosamine synthase-like glycosyltransferase